MPQTIDISLTMESKEFTLQRHCVSCPTTTTTLEFYLMFHYLLNGNINIVLVESTEIQNLSIY